MSDYFAAFDTRKVEKMTKREYAKKRGINKIYDINDNLDEELDEEFKEFIDLITSTNRRDMQAGKFQDGGQYKPIKMGKGRYKIQ